MNLLLTDLDRKRLTTLAYNVHAGAYYIAEDARGLAKTLAMHGLHALQDKALFDHVELDCIKNIDWIIDNASELSNLVESLAPRLTLCRVLEIQATARKVSDAAMAVRQASAQAKNCRDQHSLDNWVAAGDNADQMARKLCEQVAVMLEDDRGT